MQIGIEDFLLKHGLTGLLIGFHELLFVKFSTNNTCFPCGLIVVCMWSSFVSKRADHKKDT